MKLFKSLLLGSAAGLVAISGASAADLGVKKPAAVEYVKVCSAHGAGFFYIPGSDVCMQLSGRVRAEYLYASPNTRGDDTSSFRANGRVNVDVRQTTEYGLLRAYVRYDVYADGGRYAQSNTVGSPVSTSAYGIAQNTNAFLDKAFIQFYTGSAGFFTAGRSVSFFDFYANNDNYTALPGSDRGAVNLFAYTLTFGGGFSATLSVEDAWARRQNGAGVATVGALTYTGVAGTTFASAGQALPDIVANLRVDQAWGSAQLSGAVHQIRSSNLFVPATSTIPVYADTTYGFAVQGGVKVNLPMIAAGDYLFLQAAYGNGAIDFAGAARGLNANSIGTPRGAAAVADAYIDSLGNVKKSTAWSVVGAFVHNFTPTIQGAVYAGYGNVNYTGTGADRLSTLPVTSSLVGSSAGYLDYSVLAVGGRLNWIPVKNFTIGSEVMYTKLDPSGRVVDLYSNPTAAIATKGSYNTWTARLRFQRDF